MISIVPWFYYVFQLWSVCICTRDCGVHRQIIVEAIFSEYMPVIISVFLSLFFFFVFVRNRDVPRLRNMLVSIQDGEYMALFAFDIILYLKWNDGLAQIRLK